MGGSNPVKKVVDSAIKAGNNITTGVLREGAQAVGADGVVKGIDKFNGFQRDVGAGAVALAYDEKGKAKRAAEAESKKQAAEDAAEAEVEGKKQAAAAFDASEKERMSAGSKSRTLLTGPAGLEDEDNKKVSISRRTLGAR